MGVRDAQLRRLVDIGETRGVGHTHFEKLAIVIHPILHDRVAIAILLIVESEDVVLLFRLVALGFRLLLDSVRELISLDRLLPGWVVL